MDLSLLQISQGPASNSLHSKILPQQLRLSFTISNSVSHLKPYQSPLICAPYSRPDSASPNPRQVSSWAATPHLSCQIRNDNLLESPQLCDHPVLGRRLVSLAGASGSSLWLTQLRPSRAASRESRLAGVLPAAGRGLAGRSHPSVARRRLTRSRPFKGFRLSRGGATPLGWRVAETSKLFPSCQLLSSPQDCQHYSLRSLYTRSGPHHGARLADTPLSSPLLGRASGNTGVGRAPGVPRADAAG